MTEIDRGTEQEAKAVSAIVALLAQADRDYWKRDAAEARAGKPDPSEALIDVFRAYKNKAAFPPEQWRRLVQLAHPDKHGDSPAAIEATRWLLENRP